MQCFQKDSLHRGVGASTGLGQMTPVRNAERAKHVQSRGKITVGGNKTAIL